MAQYSQQQIQQMRLLTTERISPVFALFNFLMGIKLSLSP